MCQRRIFGVAPGAGYGKVVDGVRHQRVQRRAELQATHEVRVRDVVLAERDRAGQSLLNYRRPGGYVVARRGENSAAEGYVQMPENGARPAGLANDEEPQPAPAQFARRVGERGFG